ncbi:pseudouridine synthase [Buchnera aphidicola (Hyadaphis tataricae)]|uniref:Pseudouridine synthase n=1 Tax=Buchnera aphidicola (Hyadaphis tataricae) TaxID=1241859 RepID=A0A4D6XYH9_9GAMM|nr:pseudouridine synthase [Buchnera aphidicola]QCI21583.1 pseudouridine synthase [Buchnera aphidicola (Hyadaphis tataricae)]
MSEKIQKILARYGYGSRRNIEKIIKSGNVLINNKKILIGQRIDLNNINNIIINGDNVLIKKKISTKVLVYNKPEGEICTRSDFKHRPTVFKKLPILNCQKWISVGRLDLNTSGLLLFTNNGNLANQLMHPSNEIEREYYIRVFGKINKNTMNILKNGVKIKDLYVSFKDIELITTNNRRRNQWLKGIICEGKNREIRRIFETVQCRVNRLIRIRYGNIYLPKELKSGHYFELNSISINNLSKLISIKH